MKRTKRMNSLVSTHTLTRMSCTGFASSIPVQPANCEQRSAQEKNEQFPINIRNIQLSLGFLRHSIFDLLHTRPTSG